jgi:hypothetical protein
MKSAKGDFFSTGEPFLKYKNPSIGGHCSRFERQSNGQSLLQKSGKKHNSTKANHGFFFQTKQTRTVVFAFVYFPIKEEKKFKQWGKIQPKMSSHSNFCASVDVSHFLSQLGLSAVLK